MISRRVMWSACVVCIAMVLGYLSLELSRQARLVPQIALTAAVLFTIMHCVASIAKQASNQKRPSDYERFLPWCHIGWFLGAPVAILSMGLTAGAGLYTLLYLRFRTQTSIKFAITYAVAMSALLFAVTQLVFPQLASKGLAAALWSTTVL